MHCLNETRSHKPRLTLLATAVLTAMSMTSAFSVAQEVADEEAEIIEVRGIAESYRNAISEKRNAATIVDALSSADIGALPDLSVAETLERITGVTGDRFKGNASEISIRGLGPFLGFATVNGRAISSGSGNRSVAFSQFPSELVNGVVVYKAQKADLLEGGVSGLIDLKTIKPIDYGKERFQAEIKGNYNPYQSKFDGDKGIGVRTSTSYTNSFDLDDGGKLGFAIGYAGANTSSPEESYNTSSTLRDCNSDYAVDGGSNCSMSNGNAAANGGNAANGDYYFISNSFYYRQMESKENRDAVIGAIQWQPNQDLDINLDGQWSNRYYYEDRHDLLWDDGRRRISNWTTNDEGAPQAFTIESRASSYGEYRVREEDYKGVGLNIDWQASSELRVEFDAAYSGTERYQTRIYSRFRGQRAFYDWKNSDGQDFPTITGAYTKINDPSGTAIDWLADIQDLSNFNADSEARNYRFDIKDTIGSYRLELDYAIDEGFFTNISTGLSFSSHKHDNYEEQNNSLATPSAERASKLATVASACAIDFPQSGYGEDANSPVSSWAVYDTQCAYDTLVGTTDLSVDPTTPSAGDVRLKEDVTSLYAMAEFSTEWGNIPVDGNLGVRYVKTDVESIGVRTSYSVLTDPNGFISFETNTNTVEFNTLTHDYTNLLPSVNVSFGLTDDLQLRAAAYAGLSRPDMWFFGAGRDIGSVTTDEGFTTVAAALDGKVSAVGNPYLEALESNNYDLSLSYYMGTDTMFSAAVYYKTFSAAFESASDSESVVVDGVSYDVVVQGRPTIVDDNSSIIGYELSALHRFSTLPAPFDSLGVSINYNYADSDFETPEAAADITPEVRAQITPSTIAGLSKHNFSSQLYWEGEVFSARLSYKFRSEYLKPFGASLAQSNRIVDDTASVDLDFGYEISKNLKAKFQVINLTNEPYVEQRVAHEFYNRIEYSGARYFLGLQYRM